VSYQAEALARKLAQKSPLALQVIKSVVRERMNVDLNSTLEFEARRLGYLATSEDSKEGTAAF
jgi:enoyl-CoA hydratase/carnithine racemase